MAHGWGLLLVLAVLKFASADYKLQDGELFEVKSSDRVLKKWDFAVLSKNAKWPERFRDHLIMDSWNGWLPELGLEVTLLAHIHSKKPFVVNGVKLEDMRFELVRSTASKDGEVHFFVIHEDDLQAPTTRCVNMNMDNVRELMDEGPWFVKFYQKSCRKCRKYKEAWEELADRINDVRAFNWLTKSWQMKRKQRHTHVQVACIECEGPAKPICQSYMKSPFAHLNPGFPSFVLIGKNEERERVSFPITFLNHTVEGWEEWLHSVNKWHNAAETITELVTEYETNHKDREKEWTEAEPDFEKGVAELNSRPGIKFAHMSNFEDLVGTAAQKGSNNQLLLHFYDDRVSEKAGRKTSELSFERWAEAANLLALAEVTHVTLAMVDCGRFARLCYSHPTIAFPFRRDLFPQGVAFNAKHPAGKVFPLDLNKEQTWKDVLQYIPDKKEANDAILQVGAFEKLIGDDGGEGNAAATISDEEMDEL